MNQLHLRFEGAEDRIGVGVEDDGGLAQGGVEDLIGGGDLCVLFVGEELAAVVVDGVVGVLEGMAGEDEDDALFPADLALGDELLEASEGDGGGGLAADALGADLGLGEGDLLLGDLLAPAAGGAEGTERPCARRPGLPMRMAVARVLALTGISSFAAVVVGEPAIERVGAFGLDDADLRDARDEAEMVHLGEALGKCGAVGEVAAGNDDVLGDLPLELLDELEGGGLLAFEAVGVDRVEQDRWESG